MRQIDYCKKIAPLNISGRTTAEIVKTLEAKVAPYLIDGSSHSVTCRCEKCVQAYIDKVLAKSNALVSAPIEIERWEN